MGRAGKFIMAVKVMNSLFGGGNYWFSVLARRSLSTSSRAVIDMAEKDGELRVFVVAGEVSGDSIGARLMASLKKISPAPVSFAGVGGHMMSHHGLKSLFPMEDIAVMGIWEVILHLKNIRVRLRETIGAALSFKPHVVVTVDSKGFSFRLLQELRETYSEQGLDSPMHFHYVAPSFWAWRGGEAKLKWLSKFVDHVFCILPFEEVVLKSNGLAATFVGHPALEDVLELNSRKQFRDWMLQGNGEDFRNEFEVPSEATVISVLPGSRLQEVTRMLPIFSNTMKILNDSLPELRFVVHVAPNQHVESYINQEVCHWPVPVILVPGSSTKLKYDAFRASKAALCTSGTVAMELQLAQLPFVVAYRAHLLTEWFIRYKAIVPYISLPNILLNSPVIPEVLFQACTPVKLGSIMMELLQNEGLREQQRYSAEKIIRLLSPPTDILPLSDPRWYTTPSMIAAYTLLNYRKQC